MSRPPIDRSTVMPAIFKRMREGESLREICSDDELPDISSIERWLAADPELYAQYTRARESRGDYWADRSIKVVIEPPRLVEDPNHKAGAGATRMDSADVAWKRLQADTFKWVAARMHPNQYADKVKQEISGSDGGPLVVSIERTIVRSS